MALLTFVRPLLDLAASRAVLTLRPSERQLGRDLIAVLVLAGRAAAT